MSGESSQGGLSAVWTAALAGAVTRPIVVFAFWHSEGRGNDTWFSILFTSIVVGLLVGLASGAVAQSSGSSRSPWAGPLMGGLTGAFVSFGTSVVTLVFLCMASYRPRSDFASIPLYWGVMSLVGAFPGILGGIFANQAREEAAEAIRQAELLSMEGHPSQDADAERQE